MPDGFVTLAQLIKADDCRGKRVRFSAFVKTRAVTRGAGLWMRVDGSGGMLAFDNMTNRLIMRTTDWTRVSVVLDVPSTNMTSPMPDRTKAEQVRRQYEHAPLVLMNPGFEPG